MIDRAASGSRPGDRARLSRLRGSVGLLSAAVILVGLAIIIAVVLALRWAPSRDAYPVQGVAISAANGIVEWPTLRASGADFAYLQATDGSDRRDSQFAENWAGAGAAGLRYGAIHNFSLCRLASDQARLFIATVPRDNAALPPVVSLDFAPDCTARPSRDLVLSELNTFLNEIEAHSGKPAVLRIAKAFEQDYQISGGLNRTIWLSGNFSAPNYGAHEWVMWTANDRRRVDGADGAVAWTVVRP